MYERFDNKAIEVVLHAQEQACQVGHACVDSEHLLLGLVAARGGVASFALESFGVTLPLLKNKIGEDIDSKTTSCSQPLDLPLSECSQRVVDLAWSSAQVLKQGSIGTHNLLAALIDEPNGRAANLLTQLGIDLRELRERSITMASEQTEWPVWVEQQHDTHWDTVDFKSLGGFMLQVIEKILNDPRGNPGYLRELCSLLGKVLKVSRVLILSGRNIDVGLKCREWQSSKVFHSCRDLRWPGEDSAILKMILVAKQPVLISGNGLETMDSNVQSEMHLLGAQSLLGSPFRHEDQSYGCLVLQNCDHRTSWDSEHLSWLQKFSDLFGAFLAKQSDERT